MDEKEEIFEEIVKYVEENSQVIKNLSEKTETLENEKCKKLEGYISDVEDSCAAVLGLIITFLFLAGWKCVDKVKDFEHKIGRLESRIEELEEIIEENDNNIELKDDYGSISYSSREKGYIYKPSK